MKSITKTIWAEVPTIFDRSQIFPKKDYVNCKQDARLTSGYFPPFRIENKSEKGVV